MAEGPGHGMEEGNATSDLVESGAVGCGGRSDGSYVDARMNGVIDFLVGLSVSELILLWTVATVVLVAVHWMIRSTTPPDEDIEAMRAESQRLKDALAPGDDE